MTRSTVWTRLFGALAAAAFLTWLVRPLVVFWEPAPRLDLLASLVWFSLAGGAWWLAARSAPRVSVDAPSPGEISSHPVPRSLPHPFRQSWQLPVLLLVCLVTPISAAVAGSYPDGETARTVAAVKARGAVIDSVEVLEVRASTTLGTRVHTYVSHLVLAVPDRQGNTHRVEARARTVHGVRPGDQVTALYSPEAPELGVIVDDGNLKGLLGGVSREWLMIAVLWGLLSIGFTASLGWWSPEQKGRRALRTRIRERKAVGCPVRVRGGTPQELTTRNAQGQELRRTSPALLVETRTDGRTVLRLVVDRHFDLASLAGDLADCPGWLCWIPDHERSAAGTLPAALVTHDGQVLWGAVLADEIQALTPTTVHTADIRGRALGPYNPWRPRVHPPGLWAVAAGVLAAAAQAGFQPAGFRGFLTTLVVIMSPAVAALVWWRRRTRLLRDAPEVATT